jgi:hypothetical protein
MARLLHPTSFVLPLAAWLVACSGAAAPEGGQTGAEQGRCAADTTREVAPDEVTPVGSSVNTALAAANGAVLGLLRFENGTQSALTLTFAQTGPARFEERSYHDDGSSVEIALGCDNALVIPIAFTFATADGRFDERWELDYTVTSGESGSLFTEVDLAALNGSYTLDIDTSSYTRVRVYLTLRALGTTLSGSLDAQGERRSMGDSVSATNISLATF